MIDIQKRPAVPSDEAFMRKLHKAAYHDVVVRQFGCWDDEVQYSFFTEKWCPEKFEIIEFDGKAIGCISVSSESDKIFIFEIQLLPEFQGRGIGTELVCAEIRTARSQQKPVHLQVLRKNERARAFYERLGFVVSGTTVTHFEMCVVV